MGHIWSIVYIWCWEMYIEEEVYRGHSLHMVSRHVSRRGIYRGHSLHMVLGHVSRGDI